MFTAKRIFIASGIIFAIVLVTISARYFLNRTSNKEDAGTVEEKNTVSGSVQNNTNEAEGKGDAKIKKIVDGAVLGAGLNGDKTRVIYYQNQKFLSTNFEGTSKNSIGAYPFNKVESVVWSSKKNKAIIKAEGGFYLYSLDDDRSIKLKNGLDSVAWNNSGDKIIYKYFDSNSKERTLNVADPDGSNWKKIVDLTFPRVDMITLPGNKIAFYPMADSLSSTELNLIDITGENKTKIFEGKFGADFLFSPDGMKVLVSSVQEKGSGKTLLGVMNERGGEYKDLLFPGFVKKCVWSKDSVNVFCAMVSGFPAESILPNDWMSKKYNSTDSFWKVNTENGKKERLISVEDLAKENAVDGENFFLDEKENRLFFSDRKTGSLYEVEL